MLLLLLLLYSIATDNDSVVSLIRFQSNLLSRLEALLLQLVYFSGEHSFSSDSGVDTTGFDGDHKVTLVLEEILRIEGNNTGLIGLGNIREDDIDHTDEHSIFLGVASVLHDGDDVCSLLGQVDQITA